MKTVKHKFVESVPRQIEEGILYISIEYATAIHNCACGCGNEVVTPLSPTDWKLTFDGQTVSLYPSIGNWSFACRSHYWIKNNLIEFASEWTEKEIIYGRENDSKYKKVFYKELKEEKIEKQEEEKIEAPVIKEKIWSTLWRKLWKFLG